MRWVIEFELEGLTYISYSTGIEYAIIGVVNLQYDEITNYEDEYTLGVF